MCKFYCICYRSPDRIFDIVCRPVILLLLEGFIPTYAFSKAVLMKIEETGRISSARS